MNFGFLRLPLLTVFFPSLLLPKSSALVQSGKRECSAFSKNCQEQSALFLKIFSFFFAPFWGGPARDWRGGGAVGGAGRRRQWSGSATPQSPAAACRRRRQRNVKKKKTPRKCGVRFAAGSSSALAQENLALAVDGQNRLAFRAAEAARPCSLELSLADRA